MHNLNNGAVQNEDTKVRRNKLQYYTDVIRTHARIVSARVGV